MFNLASRTVLVGLFACFMRLCTLVHGRLGSDLGAVKILKGACCFVVWPVGLLGGPIFKETSSF